MTEKGKMLAGKIYDSSDKELAELRAKVTSFHSSTAVCMKMMREEKLYLTSFFPTMARDFFSKALCILTMAFSQSSAQAAMQTSI